MFATFWLCAPSAAWSETLSFCYDPYPPYTLGETGAPTGGLKVALLEEVVAGIEGLSATVELLPWRRCQAEVREGRLDGILPLFPNDERAAYMAFSDVTFQEKAVFWYDRERFPDGLSWSSDFNALSHLELGMLSGGYIDREMQDAFEAGAGITHAATAKALFLMLLHERIALIATDHNVGLHYVRELGVTGRFVPIERPITSKGSRFGLSSVTGASRYLDDFNRIIRALHQSGRMGDLQNGRP